MFRMLAYALLRPFVRENNYRDSASVGYMSSLSVFDRCIAFRKLDGRLQFRW